MRPNMMTANTSVGMAMNGPCCPAKEEIWDKKYQKKIAGECKMPYYRSENVSTFSSFLLTFTFKTGKVCFVPSG